MARAPDYTKEEFEILLQSPRITDDELSHQLGRAIGSIRVVRSFIHNFHKGGDVSELSKMMIHRLQQGSWTCPRCDFTPSKT